MQSANLPPWCCSSCWQHPLSLKRADSSCKDLRDRNPATGKPHIYLLVCLFNRFKSHLASKSSKAANTAFNFTFQIAACGIDWKIVTGQKSPSEHHRWEFTWIYIFPGLIQYHNHISCFPSSRNDQVICSDLLTLLCYCFSSACIYKIKQVRFLQKDRVLRISHSSAPISYEFLMFVRHQMMKAARAPVSNVLTLSEMTARPLHFGQSISRPPKKS